MEKGVLLRKSKSAIQRVRTFVKSARFGCSPDSVYGAEFFEGGGFAKTEASARAIVGYLLETYSPASVLDVGCGMGNYLKHFAAAGCRVFGVEGSSTGLARIPGTVLALQHDLRRPLMINQQFDLVMSVEVAEHIPRWYSATFVNSVCRHARDLVVFTAAPPGMPGDDHVNCQAEPYWSNLFAKNGFLLADDETARLRRHARQAETVRWFQEWAFVYRSDPEARRE